MRAWFENIAGPQYATGVMWTIAALIVLVILLVLARIIRSLTAGTFVAGGRNRRTRLAVMDAAAVDNQRRLVLVRRDDVEHLILIGGPTDVVVERNIGLAAAAAQTSRPLREEPALAEPPVHAPPPRPESKSVPEPVSPVRQTQAQKPEPVVPVPPSPPPAPKQSPETPALHNIAPARPEHNGVSPESPRPAPPKPAQQAEQEPAARPHTDPEQEFHPAPVAPPAAEAKPEAAPQSRASDIDRALAKEIETAAATKPAPDAPERPNSLEDEMSRLLGELSRERG